MSETLRSFHVAGSLDGLDFAGQLREAMVAIKNTLENVWDKLGSVRRLQKPSRWRMWEKMMVVWDEDQLRKWDEILGRQVILLNGLLTAQNHYHAQLEKTQQQPQTQQQQRSHAPRVPEKQSTRTLVQARSSISSEEYDERDAYLRQNTIEYREPWDDSDPDMDDGAPVLDADGSMGIQARLENELAAVEALPQSQADSRMRSLAAGGEMAQKVVNSLKIRAGALVEGHPDMKFRILLMGKQANGKTTLCNKVLGIDLPQSLYGDSTPFDHVYEEQTFDGANPDIVIHDAGGFENGSSKGTDTLRAFLKQRCHDAADVAQRVHCIWYVIACNGSKPIHPIDEQFLRNHFGVAKIPVFVVVTKYDRVVDDCREAAGPGASQRDVEAMAYDEVKRSTLDRLTELARTARDVHGMNVEICTVGLRKRGAEFTPGPYKPAGLRQCG
ncbi:hypothetical protein C8A05DRAFT_30207 [Staphylotrichum tortipilum]|uniref:G domain-containing protein n=1 Tax=Staphylotrichum tortipilum TaxID=2831512 RepID=A0AAN6MSY3_9PEZI|nr:hypothetical protein C8A05DRAFT_30207 [Staphylotrichum longicolle]